MLYETPGAMLKQIAFLRDTFLVVFDVVSHKHFTKQ